MPIGPKGHLADYVPFYFAPRSPMLYSIYNNKVAVQDDIVYLVSEYDKIVSENLDFVFTDGQAMMGYSQYFNQKADLKELDWALLQDKFWNNTDEDNDRMRRRNAEFLVHKHVPTSCLVSIGIKTKAKKNDVENKIKQFGLTISAKVVNDWYY